MKILNLLPHKTPSVEITCHFNQPYNGKINIFAHFDYLFRGDFIENNIGQIKLDLVDADYLELLSTIKQDLFSADLYLANLEGQQSKVLQDSCEYQPKLEL